MGQPLITLYTSDPSIPDSSPTPYVLTDHNRQPLQISYETIEQSSRMADGTMRRFITANKRNVRMSWDEIPSAGGINFTFDNNQGGAFLKSFYEENVFYPVWIKLTYSEESWRFQNTNTVTANVNASATNKTFNTTIDNYRTAIPSTYQVASVSYSALSSGSATASITTTVPHNFTASAVPEVYINGVNQIFNGAWILNTTNPFPNNQTAVFTFNANGNSYATVHLNSYSQSGANATFNVDSTDMLQTNMTFQAKNSRVLSGSSIGSYTWTVTGISSSTQFTASTGTSQTGAGIYGDMQIISSASSRAKAIAGFPLATISPAIGSEVIKVFMKDFNYQIKKRYAMTDIVNVEISFVEI